MSDVPPRKRNREKLIDFTLAADAVGIPQNVGNIISAHALDAGQMLDDDTFSIDCSSGERETAAATGCSQTSN